MQNTVQALHTRENSPTQQISHHQPKHVPRSAVLSQVSSSLPLRRERPQRNWPVGSWRHARRPKRSDAGVADSFFCIWRGNPSRQPKASSAVLGLCQVSAPVETILAWRRWWIGGWWMWTAGRLKCDPCALHPAAAAASSSSSKQQQQQLRRMPSQLPNPSPNPLKKVVSVGRPRKSVKPRQPASRQPASRQPASRSWGTLQGLLPLFRPKKKPRGAFCNCAILQQPGGPTAIASRA